MLFGPRSRPLIGLDITTSSIKLIELTQSGKSYRAESYAAEPTPPNSINEKTIVDAILERIDVDRFAKVAIGIDVFVALGSGCQAQLHCGRKVFQNSAPGAFIIRPAAVTFIDDDQVRLLDQGGDDLGLLLEMVKHGHGVGLTREHFARDKIDAGEIVRLFDMQTATPPHAYYVVYEKQVAERLAALGVAVADHHPPRTRAARVRAALGSAGEALAATLEQLDAQRYGRPGRHRPEARWWRQFSQEATNTARALQQKP